MNLSELSQLTEEEARAFFEQVRWPNGPVCPHCGSTNVGKLQGKATRPGVYKCKAKGCRKQFTVTVNTVMERSHIPLRKWLMAIHLMCSSKKGVSAHQLHRTLGIKSYGAAWHLAHRIRYAMTSGGLAPLLKGTVEMDETYVGGRSREGKKGRGSERKTPVVALVERDGNLRAKPVDRVTAKNLKGAIRESVRRDARIVTDEWPSYSGIGKEFLGGHLVVRHGIGEYVRGEAHTKYCREFFRVAQERRAWRVSSRR